MRGLGGGLVLESSRWQDPWFLHWYQCQCGWVNNWPIFVVLRLMVHCYDGTRDWVGLGVQQSVLPCYRRSNNCVARRSCWQDMRSSSEISICCFLIGLLVTYGWGSQFPARDIFVVGAVETASWRDVLQKIHCPYEMWRIPFMSFLNQSPATNLEGYQASRGLYRLG